MLTPHTYRAALTAAVVKGQRHATHPMAGLCAARSNVVTWRASARMARTDIDRQRAREQAAYWAGYVAALARVHAITAL